MLDGQQSFVYGMFHDRSAAHRAVQHLIDAHFDEDRISTLTKEPGGVQNKALVHKTWMPKGAVIGGILGTIAGVITIFAIGLSEQRDAFDVVMAGLTGAFAGILVGVLAGLGYWRDEPRMPREGLEEQAVIVGVLAAPERAEDAKRPLLQAGAREVQVATRQAAERQLAEISMHARTP